MSHGCVSKILSRYAETGSYKPGVSNRRQTKFSTRQEIENDVDSTVDDSDESKSESSEICSHYQDNQFFHYLDNSLNDTLPMRTVTHNRRSRSAFSTEQLEILEQFFSHTPYPDVTTRENLAQRLNIEENRIQIWFSNRRARNRKATTVQEGSPKVVNNEENLVSTFLATPPMEMNVYTQNENGFDPSVTSSPSSSKSSVT